LRFGFMEQPDVPKGLELAVARVCPLLKVNRPCRRAAVTSQFDPQQTFVRFPIAASLMPALLVGWQYR
jgi:hypothetical protein